jgi:hypothetical protein
MVKKALEQKEERRRRDSGSRGLRGTGKESEGKKERSEGQRASYGCFSVWFSAGRYAGF